MAVTPIITNDNAKYYFCGQATKKDATSPSMPISLSGEVDHVPDETVDFTLTMEKGGTELCFTRGTSKIGCLAGEAAGTTGTYQGTGQFTSVPEQLC
jgi:hypothetical protein